MDGQGGVPALARALWIRPTVVPASRVAEVPGGGADGDGAGLGAQGEGAAGGLGDPDVAPDSADLGVAVQAADGDVGVGDSQAGGGGVADRSRWPGRCRG